MEIISYIASSFFFYIILRKPAKEISKKQIPKSNPLVDILIATYNEPIDIVEATMISALGINYKNKCIYICDDGKRAQIREMANKYNVNYICRDVNLDFKAGNLNNALRVTKGDFVLTLDADHICFPNILDELVSSIEIDFKIALVQTPQEYYNINSYIFTNIEKTKVFWHESSFFYYVVQPGLSERGAALYVGTGALVRKSALEKIGGFATGSVTEDVFTSMRLHAAGFKVIYRPIVLGYLLAAESPIAYYTQRLRWTEGGVQILLSENPLFKKGLSFKQRILHLNHYGSFLTCFIHLFYLICPLLVMLTNSTPFSLKSDHEFSFLLIKLAIDLLFLKFMAGGQARIHKLEFFKVQNLPIYLKSVMRAFKIKGLKFKVTPKGFSQEVPFLMYISNCLIMGANFFAISLAVRSMIYLEHANYELVTFAIIIFFSAINFSLGGYSLLRLMKHHRMQKRHYFKAKFYGDLNRKNGATSKIIIRKINYNGIIFDCNEEVRGLLQIVLDKGYLKGEFEVRIDKYSVLQKSSLNKYRMLASWNNLSILQKTKVLHFIISSVNRFYLSCEDAPEILFEESSILQKCEDNKEFNQAA